MAQEEFKASTQYNVWIGSVAGDNSDAGSPVFQNSIRHYLDQEGLLQDGEDLIAMKVIANIPSGKFKYLTIIFYASTTSDKQDARIDGAVQVRKFEKDMSPQQFFDRFKRFQLTLSVKGTLEKDKLVI